MRRMFSLKQLQEIADSEVKSLVEGGTLENAKPLYFHPITLLQNENVSAVQWYCSMIIINNNSEPIDSLDKLTATFDDIFDNLPEGVTTARFPCTGTFANATNWIILGAIEITGKTTSTRKFTGRNGIGNTTLSLLFNSFDYTPRVFDGVNKIN